MKTESHFKTLARFAPTTWMTAFKKSMKQAGYNVEATADTVVVRDNGEVVARGLKMGRMGWMVRANPDVVKPAPDAVDGPTLEAVIR
jgi:hypothetical protein